MENTMSKNTNGISGTFIAARESVNRQEVYYLFGLLVLLQAADAALTAFGIASFGVQAEGNALLRFLMSHIGYASALAITKTLAILVILFMALKADAILWIKSAFGVLCGIYLSAAIIPWTYIVATHWIA